jgi:protein MpaA
MAAMAVTGKIRAITGTGEFKGRPSKRLRRLPPLGGNAAARQSRFRAFSPRAARRAAAAAAAGLLALTLAGAAQAGSECADFVRQLPNINAAQCAQAQLVASTARSVHGRPIYMRDLPAEGAKLRVLVIGGIHGDESSSASVALHWIRLALQDPAQLPQPVHWRFIPAVNPDGLFDKPPRRVNANGVDLNRNFPTPNWERDAKVYWEQRTRKDPRRYPGPKPLSEPETRFVHEEIQSFKPNLIVSIHAPYGVLDFDGPSVPPSKLGRLYLDQVGIFPGSLGNYGGVHKGVPVVTIELPNSMRTPLDAETRQMWLDLLRWMSERVMDRGPRVP